MKDLIGQHLGRYHIVQQLGEGGMATVYKAYDTRLERYVAVKVIRVEKEQDVSFLKRFEREAKALARLSHPNIVHVNDYGEQDGMPYVVMDFIPGGTLKQKLGMPISFQEAARLLAPLARALEHAHQNGIIHRDVKPANVLLTAHGEPMLSDFGIAKMLETEQTSELTGTGVGIGTPEYMAPEQGSGEKIDERADIYALGVVFYELITGRKPFRADTPVAVVLKHLTEPLPRPSSFVPNLPDSVEQVIFKALAKKPVDRYQTMEKFAQALELLAQTPVPLQAETVIAPTKIQPTPQNPPAPSKTKLSVPVIGTVLGGVIILAVLVLLGVCVVGYIVNLNLSGKPTPPANGQVFSTPDAAQNETPLSLTKTPRKSTTSTPRGKVTQDSEAGFTPPAGLGMLAQRTGDIKKGENLNLGDIEVPQGLDMLMISFGWGEGEIEPVVVTPDGTTLDIHANQKNVMVITQTGMVGFNVIQPAGGIWKFSLTNAVPAGDNETLFYSFMVSYPEK